MAPELDLNRCTLALGRETMHWLLVFTVVLGLGVIVADAQSPTEPQTSPKEVVEQYYKMQAEGRWLGPERWDELQDS